MANKYNEYFAIDSNYFPCIDESAIDAGAPWDNTYPHETFIGLLKSVDRMLGGSTKRSIWIHGAYGTGKSQCAYALRKILEAPDEDIRNYWDKYGPLKEQPDLLGKLLGYKKRRIITVHRYASGGIKEPRDFFFAVQESVKAALIEKEVRYKGENTLKESIIAWIDKPANKRWFDDLLSQSEYSTLFSHSTADDVLAALRRGGEVKTLVDNLFRLADKEGITALKLDAEGLKT
jgi:hypothetical protein